MNQRVQFPQPRARSGRFAWSTLVLAFLLLTPLAHANDTQVQDLLNRRLTLRAERMPLKEVLRDVEKKAQVRFLYSPEVVQADRRVSLDATDQTLQSVLDGLLKPLKITYEVSGQQIILDKENAPVSRPAESAPTRPVRVLTGTVTDGEKNQALPGVSVLLKGTQTGTTTNAEGRYSLSIPDGDGSVLVFSYVGYVRQEVPVGNATSLNVTLQPDAQGLDEVVVIGYGEVRKRDLTGAVASVSSKDIQAVPVLSADQALQGRAAGVQVTQTNAAPGGAVSIRIRGGNSITAGNEPLFVVDGFPGAGDLNSINPNDIESIEILKDASATAIYGARGANGVVLITTRRGKTGAPRVEYNAYYGQQTVRKTLDLMNASEYARLLADIKTADPTSAIATNIPNFNNPAAPNYTDPASLGEGTNWQREIFRKAPIQNHQLMITGGTETAKYAVSGNVFDQQGILLNSRFQRYSFRANLDLQLSRRLKLGTSLTAARTRDNGVQVLAGGTAVGSGGLGARGVIGRALFFSPIETVFNPDGTYNLDNAPYANPFGNPVASLTQTTNQTTGSRFLGNAFLEYEITKGLKFKTLFGTDLFFNKRNFYAPQSGTFEGSVIGGYGAVTTNTTNQWLNENTLSYSRNFGQKHDLSGVVGVTAQASRNEVAMVSARGFVNDVLTFNDLRAGTADPAATGSSQWGLVSYLARVNYSYGGKYTLTVNARTDGSSRFGAGNKYAFFPSAALGWILSEEDFLKKQSVLSFLKLRASYGLTGSQEIPPYSSLGALAVVNYAYGNTVTTGFAPDRLPNPNLRWETTAQANVGLDLSLWQNRVSLTADWYHKRTNDLLLNVPVPWISGFQTVLTNAGSLENKGIELSLTARLLEGPLRWDLSGNFARNRNKILSLGFTDFFYAGRTDGGLNFPEPVIVQVGQPLGTFVGVVTNGIWQTGEEITSTAKPNTRPGDRKFVDQNSDKVITAADRVILGTAQPKFIYGFTNTWGYKGLELSVFVQGVYGNKIFNQNTYFLENPTGSTNVSRTVLDRWSETNPSQTISRATVNGDPLFITSRMIEDGSFLRVRNITLGYTLPTALTSRWKISRARVYVSGQNLITLTNYSGYDPEVNVFGGDNLAVGVDSGAYPTSKMVLVGLNLGF